MVADNIRILIAEAHDYLREQLAILLDAYEGMQVVGTADNGKKAVDLCISLRPNIVLIDAVMPALDGFSATRAIRQQFPHIQVAILSSGFIGEHQLAIDAGAKALLRKPISSEEIANAIRAVHTGGYNWSLLS
jgi:DNA-binding NarL/FixJ family response regulator